MMQISSRKFWQRFWPIWLLSASSFAPFASAQFKASTELVVVDALVEHRKTGAAVGSLQRDDFEVYEDKVRQQITQFSRDTVPLSIVFLFDMTDSVRPVLKPLAQGALAALKHLKPEDEIAVMLYAGRADLTQEFTRDHSLVTRAIESASRMHSGDCGAKPELCDQPAYFNEGIFTATSLLHKAGNPSNRRVIIWLTDNVPNIPDDKVHSEAAAFDLLHESGVVICSLLEKSGMSIGMGAAYTKNPLFAPLRMGHPPGDVGKYAAETGGISIGAHRDEISAKLAGLIDRIRSRYTIGYRPSVQKPDGTLCKIDVKLSKAAIAREGAVEVRARRGYKR
jgi:VWFA-related protein